MTCIVDVVSLCVIMCVVWCVVGSWCVVSERSQQHSNWRSLVPLLLKYLHVSLLYRHIVLSALLAIPWSLHFVLVVIYKRCFLTQLTALGCITLLSAAVYAVHLGFIGKLAVDFLFVLIELFLLGVMAEALRANVYWKSGFWRGLVSFCKIFT